MINKILSYNKQFNKAAIRLEAQLQETKIILILIIINKKQFKIHIIQRHFHLNLKKIILHKKAKIVKFKKVNKIIL